MTPDYRGECMCGAVQFSFTGQPRFVADCTCASCRKAHGASAVGWVGVQNPQFSLDAGDEVLAWYQSSPASRRGFCRSCGTRLLFQSQKWPGETHMALACMTEPHDLVSTKVSFLEELPEWVGVVAKG